MRLELILPDESPTMPPSVLLDLAQLADRAGFGTVWLPDHVLPPEPFGTTYGGVYEPLVTLAAIAARTQRIRLGTSVIIAPLRNPFVLAKQAATIHRLSGERLVLGLGAGWEPAEFASLGIPFRERGPRLDDTIGVLRALWTGKSAYEGPFFSYDAGVLEPRPHRPIALVTGGVSPRALRRAAELADEWQGLGHTPDTFSADVGRLRSLTDRPLRVRTRIGWDDAADITALAELADGFCEAGADGLAIWLGDHEQAISRLTALIEHDGLRRFLR